MQPRIYIEPGHDNHDYRGRYLNSDPCIARSVSPTDDLLTLEPVGTPEPPARTFQPLGMSATMEDICYFTPEIVEVSDDSTEEIPGDTSDRETYLTLVEILRSLVVSHLDTKTREIPRVESDPHIVRLAITEPEHVAFDEPNIHEYITELGNATDDSDKDEIVTDFEIRVTNEESETKVSDEKSEGSLSEVQSGSSSPEVKSKNPPSNAEPGSSSTAKNLEVTRYQHNIINKRGEKNDAKQPKNVLCVRCKRYVQSQVHLKRHVDTVHFGLRPYICKIPHNKDSLKKKFKRKDHLSKHLRTVHGMNEVEIKEYQEENCPK